MSLAGKNLSRNAHLIAVLLLWICCTDIVRAQSTANFDSIGRLIDQLGAEEFRVRQQAGRQLETVGQPAVEALEKIQQNGSPEQRLRAGQILERIQRDSFVGRLHRLEISLSKVDAQRLPMWTRYSEIVGRNESALRGFIRIMQAEPQLFATMMTEPRSVSPMLQTRVSEIAQSLTPGVQSDQAVTADSVAAVLLIASDESIRLIGATSTTVSQLLLAETEFDARLLASAEDSIYRKLAGAWVLRRGIAVQRPLVFAKTRRLSQGPILARRVLNGRLRGVDAWYAITLLAESGNESDLPLLESLFDNTSTLYSGRNRLATDIYRVEVGDAAQAAAILLHGDDPRDFGFPILSASQPFTLIQGTAGFTSDEHRKKSRALYREKYPDQR